MTPDVKTHRDRQQCNNRPALYYKARYHLKNLRARLQDALEAFQEGPLC